MKQHNLALTIIQNVYCPREAPLIEFSRYDIISILSRVWQNWQMLINEDGAYIDYAIGWDASWQQFLNAYILKA